MNRTVRALCAATIVCCLAVATRYAGAETSVEDLLKKGDSTSQSTTTVAPAQIPTTMPAVPKSEVLRAPQLEKVKLSDDDQQLLNGKDQKEQARKTGKDRQTGKESAEAKDADIKKGATDAEPASALEKLITSDETLEAGKLTNANPAKTLTQFGYSYFKNTSFAPLTDVPVAADYVTGPGDSLILTIWGSIEGTYELTVNRSGEVLLPKVGPVRVGGVPFGRLAETFRQKLNREFRDFRISVDMGKIRTIKVYVVGEVASPGDYTLTSLSTLLNALSAAGGPTKNGSLRDIRIRHAGRGEERVDLYDFFTRGDKSHDIRLSSGDTVFVPVVGRVAAIAGDVKRPGIYELKDEKTLADLLALAEGVSATGYLQRVQISRTVANHKKEVLDFNLDGAATGKAIEVLARAVPVQDLDIVRIYPINALLHNHFKLEGHVARPGFYALKPGMHISDALSREDLLPEYYADFLEVTRLVPPGLDPQKIVVNLDAALAHDPANDLTIAEYDVIRVFSRVELERQAKVRVGGEVLKPGEYRLFKAMTVRDLLIQAGYPTDTAYLENAEITRLDKSKGRVHSFPIAVNLARALQGDPKENIELKAFDELTVRKIPNWVEETDRYITLSGEFRFPGTYPIYKGEKLSSVIERAGGFTDKAYLQGAKFTRDSLRELQQKRMDEALARAEEEVGKKQAELASSAGDKEGAEASKEALEGLKRNILVLKGKRAEGRMVVSLKSLADLKAGRGDLEVKGGDTLSIPSDPEAVSILGQVYNPTSVAFEEGRNAGHYLKLVGGANKDADRGEIYVVKMNGTVFSRHQASFFNSFERRNIDSGDTIIVPTRYDKSHWMRDLKDIATIVGQVALTAGVVVAAGL